MTGKDLRKFRKDMGWSRVELGEALGWGGTPLTLDKNIKKLEREDELDEGTVAKVEMLRFQNLKQMRATT
jgi:hypothetical protein